ncbi:Transient receptor potential channel pyrexia [Gryllus bimaculatus]|nr:Transient receptor potential channel pyrexia [Gryllus bimaculatus]
MGKKRTSKAKRKVGAIKIKKIKKLKEPDKKKDSASNFFWAVKVLKKVANKPIEVSPQNLREVLSKCPHAVATWAGKSAILNAVQLMRDDLLYVLIEAGAIIQPPGTQVCENDIPEDGDDVNSEAKALVHSVVTDASVCAFLSKCADFPHNKLNDLLREADSADAVKALLTAGVSMRAIDYCAMTALHFAAGSSRSAGCVPLLVAAGANVNAKDKFDMTPLHYAAAYGTAETVKLLLEEGADREALDQWHRTPGHTVYSECDTRERKEARAPIYWLLNPEGGGDEQTWDNIEEDYLWDVEPPLPTSQQCQQDVNVLRQLACFGDVTLKEIKIVLNRSPPLVFSYSACKALQTCAEMGRLEIINAFLKKGASPHIRECDFCSDEVFEPFVDPGYLTSSCNDWPLIHIAAAAGQVQTVDTLLAAKASKKRVWVPEYADPFGPLEAAAANGHLAMVKYLLYSGCVTDREQVDGALRLAVTPKGWQAGCKNWVEETQVRIARTLLDAGADPNARDLFGHSPVHGAAYCGWSKCLSLLIRRGSKVLAETQNGKTALHIAACGRHIVCISLLIKARANVSSKDCLGQTPLHYVAEGLMQSDWAQTQCSEDDGAEIVKALVDAGADVNCHDKNGVTALHLAAKSGSFAVVEALLNAGALINAKDRNSRTPLHYAADAGADRVVDKLIKSGADTNAKDHSGCIPHDHPKTNSASLERSDAERELENEDSEESERSWCGICSGDEWVEVESSGDDSDDWELECYRWVKELCKRSSDKEDREEIVESQLKQNTECKPNEAKKSEQDILLKSLREVETESEDEESDDDCALDEGEEVDEFTKAMKNREKISKLSIKLRLRGYVDSDAEFESRPDEDAKHTYLPPGAVSDPNALWYNKQWIKENEVCNDNASQKPSEVVSKSEADCQTEGKVDSRLKDSLLSETDHSRKVKREAEGKKECEKGQSNSVQDTQEAPVNQERDSQRDKRMKDEHEFTKELRIKVELDDDDDDDDDEEDDDDDDDDDDDEQDIPYVSGAWTVPQQSEKVGNEENDMWDRRDSKWRKVQESGRGRERHCSGKGYEREAFEKHGEERRLFGVKAERGHRFRGAQAKQEENDWKTKKVQNVFRPCAEEDAIEKLYGWEEQISHTSIRAQDDHKGSRQNEGLSRNCSYRSYNQGRDNSSTASYDWERQDLLDIQERKKRYGSHERVSFECGTHRDFGERCNEFERLSDETGNKSRSHERVSFEHGRQRGFRERHNEFERVSDERGNKSGSREKESSEYQTQRGFGERQNQFKRIKDDRGNKTFEYDDRLRKELPDYHTRLDAHKNEASCSTSRIYEDEVRMRRKLGVRGQDGYCYQAGSNEEEYERPHIGYRLSEPDRMRPHSQYSEQEQNVLHRYGEPVNQDRIQGQLRNAGENDPCKLLLIQEHHRSREQICEKTLSPYDRIGRQEHDWSMERARNIVGSQHSENWEKNSQDRLKEHEYRNLQSPRSRYDEQEHYRYASYRRQELEKNNQTSGRAYVVSHSQNRLEENAFGRSQSPRSRYVEQEYYRSSGYGRQESERFSQTSAHGDVVSHSQNRLEENEFGRLRSPKRRYDEQDHYRSTGYGRQESDKFSQTSARADVSHCQNRLEENAFGRSQSPKSRYYDQEYYRSASYGRQESEKNSQTMGRADNGSCSPHRSRIRFTERKYGGRREQARDPSDIHYSDKEYERFHSYYTSRKLSHRSCSPFSRFGPQERDISDTHYGRQGPKLYDDRKSGEHVYDRTRSPCRRVGDEMQGRLRKNKAGEMRHDRSRIQFSGSDERDFRTHTQRRWPDILEDVPH